VAYHRWREQYGGMTVEVRHSFKVLDVPDVLGELMLIRGVPGHIRSDNGPEFIAGTSGP